MTRRWSGVGAIVAIAVVLAGCSSVDSSVQLALGQARSAVQSSRLAIELEADDASTRAITMTALDDAQTELTRAQDSVAELDAGSSGTAASVDDALELIRRSSDAVRSAQRAVDGVGSLDDATRALVEASRRLADR